MKTIHYFCHRPLPDSAQDLIRFDAASIRQLVAAQRAPDPEVWLIDPGSYEKNGHVLRDSPSPRLLAYCPQTRVIYATDGCNSCALSLPSDLESIPEDDLARLAADNEIRLDLLERLARLVRGGRPTP